MTDQLIAPVIPPAAGRARSRVLDGRWATWFDGLQVSGQGEDTVICGRLADQPALHGLLTKVRDLGLCLISVRRLETGQAETRHHDRA